MQRCQARPADSVGGESPTTGDSLGSDMLITDNAVPFAETSYGIIKRIRAIEEWTERTRARRAKSSLDILDFGCGTGDHVTYPLALKGHQVLGVDQHELSIITARERYRLPNLTFRACALKELLEAGLSFDLIVCSEVLEHLERPLEFLFALHRILQPDGAIIITTPNGYGSYEMLCRLERGLSAIGVHQVLRFLFHGTRALIRKVTGAATGTGDAALELQQNPGFLNNESGHVQFFRLSVLETLFKDSGFEIVERQARTLLCGPYVDVLLRLLPFSQTLIELNGRVADDLPFSWAADWMFLLERSDRGGA